MAKISRRNSLIFIFLGQAKFQIDRIYLSLGGNSETQFVEPWSVELCVISAAFETAAMVQRSAQVVYLPDISLYHDFTSIVESS